MPEHPPAAADALARAYLAEVARGFAALERQADAAIAQLDDAELWAPLDAEANGVGVLMRHLAGNFRSRFTDFLSTDGEKPDRDRDGEFLARPELPRAALAAEWRAGWACAHAAVAALAPADLTRTVHVRGEAMDVVAALGRATRHAAWHVGQIVLLARHRRGAAWRTLSIPRGESAAWTAAFRAAQAGEGSGGG